MKKRPATANSGMMGFVRVPSDNKKGPLSYFHFVRRPQNLWFDAQPCCVLGASYRKKMVVQSLCRGFSR